MTTTLTLRKSARLRTAIDAALAAIDLRPAVTVPTSTTTEQLHTALNSERQAFEARLQTALRLEDILADIRLKHGQHNARTGLDDKLTKRISLMRKRARFEALSKSNTYDEVRVQQSLDVAQKRLAAAHNEYASEEVAVNYVAAATVETWKKAAVELRRQITAIEDEVNEINATSTFLLNDSDAEFLKAQGIL